MAQMPSNVRKTGSSPKNCYIERLSANECNLRPPKKPLHGSTDSNRRTTLSPAMTQEQLIKELVKTLEDCGLLITALHSIINWVDQLPPRLQGQAHTRKEALEAIAELDYERREALRKATIFLQSQ